MAAPNIEQFNILVGAIFAKLYETFPIPIELAVTDFAEQMLILDSTDLYGGNRKFHEIRFFTSTVLWLADHGYLSAGSMVTNSVVKNCSLTARTLELLNAFPSSLGSKGPSLGDQMVEAAKDGVTGKIKDLASEFLSKAVIFGTKTATDWAAS